MTTYILTISSDALGLGSLGGCAVQVTRVRAVMAEQYPPSDALYEIRKSTDENGVVDFNLKPDDSSVYHKCTIWDANGVPVYKRSFYMPPDNTNLDDLSDVVIGGSSIQFQADGVNVGTPTTTRTVNFTGNGVSSSFATETLTVTIDDREYIDQKATTEAAGALSSAQTYADSAAGSAEAAAKSYADGLVIGLLDDRGNFDASGGAYPSSGGSGASGAIKKGDIWIISAPGTLPASVSVDIGDTVRALTDSPGNTPANWAVSKNGSSTVITVFGASGNFTLGANTKSIEVVLQGAGGGGGSGGIATAGNNGAGGGGGGGGSKRRRVFSRAEILAAYPTGIVPVTVGLGGTAGASITGVSVANGNNGGQGGTTTFGSVLSAFGGGGGGKGTGGGSGSIGGAGANVRSAGSTESATSTDGATGGGNATDATNATSISCGAGGGGSSSLGAGGKGGSANDAGSGGGAGGGIDAGNTVRAGGAGGAPENATTGVAGGSTSGSPGNPGATLPGIGSVNGGGSGGCGGATDGGTGGAGGRGCGGGGGGGTRTGYNSGAGGVGGDGYAWITEY